MFKGFGTVAKTWLKGTGNTIKRGARRRLVDIPGRKLSNLKSTLQSSRKWGNDVLRRADDITTGTKVTKTNFRGTARDRTNKIIKRTAPPKLPKGLSPSMQKHMNSITRGGALRRFGSIATSKKALGMGAVAMVGIGMVKGVNNRAKDIVYDRYMQDQQASRSVLMNSRVGEGMGNSSMMNRGGTMGLSNALSKTRHGRR